jgi:hypothetical protein
LITERRTDTTAFNALFTKLKRKVTIQITWGLGHGEFRVRAGGR